MAGTDYDYRYIGDTDVEDYSQLMNSKLLILTGGSEYWTREARRNYERFIAEGGNVLVLAGNVMNRPVSLDDRKNPTTMTELRHDINLKANWNDAWLEYPVLESTSADFQWGGYGANAPGGVADLGWDGWKIVDDSVPYLQGTGLKNGDLVSNWTLEYDAPPITGFDPVTGIPQIDNSLLGHEFIRLIGYDRAISNSRGTEGYGAWFEYQHDAKSGRVITVGSTNWTERTQPIVRQVNANMIDYLLSLSHKPIRGDMNEDGQLDEADIEAIQDAFRKGSTDLKFDLDGNWVVDSTDRDYWVYTIANSTYGDVNLNGVFDSSDLVHLFQINQYEDQVARNSTWTTGDWNGDQEFTSADFVFAQQHARPARVAAQAVPEPTPSTLYALIVTACVSIRCQSQRICCTK